MNAWFWLVFFPIVSMVAMAYAMEALAPEEGS